MSSRQDISPAGEENLRFKAFLKTHPLSDKKLDALVRRILLETDRIDCRSCGDCCRKLWVSLTPGDTDRLTRHLGIDEDEFKLRYLADMQGKDMDLFRERPCPFQKENLCTCYESRPSNCRSYPHLGEEGFRYRLYNVFDSYGLCPIVRQTVDRLKEVLGFFELGRSSASLPV